MEGGLAGGIDERAASVRLSSGWLYYSSALDVWDETPKEAAEVSEPTMMI
jgi:hypothetical protein